MKVPTTKLAAVFYVTATFLIGALAGAAVGYGYGRKPIFRPFDRDAMRAHICSDLTSKLDLTTEQQQQLEPIVRQNMEEFDADRRQHMAQMGERMKQGNLRIRAILTPEQQAKFDEIEKSRWKDRERGRDRGKPPRADIGGPLFVELGDSAGPKEVCQNSGKRFPDLVLPPEVQTSLSPTADRP
jgi:Spy/CpxP family protein refolding chaperone